MIMNKTLTLFLLLYSCCHGAVLKDCLNLCKCSTNKKQTIIRQRVNCSGINTDRHTFQQSQTYVQDIVDLSLLPKNAFNLLLSKNALSVIKKADFQQENVHNLVKLDLSKNKIKVIEERSFNKLKKLKKLDLSRNELHWLNKPMFFGMPRLERLDLGYNAIFHIKNDTFATLNKLKSLVLDGNLIICNCDMAWLPNWLTSNKIKVSQKSTCKFPSRLAKVSLRNINSTVMTCQGQLEVPTFHISPSDHQLVFENDTATLMCSVSAVPNISIYWTFTQSQGHSISFANDTEDSRYTISEQLKVYDGILVTSISIHELNSNHSGTWTCHAKSSHKHISQQVQFTVVSTQTVYCPQVVTSGRKGMYVWPRAISPNHLKLSCEGSQQTSLNEGPKAEYTCNEHGQWVDLDTSKCPFTSEITQVLHQFDQVDIARMTKLMKAEILRNYTAQHLNALSDIDVNLLAAIVIDYMQYIPEFSRLDAVLLDIIDDMIKISADILYASNEQYRSIARLVKAIEQMPKTHGLSYVGKHVTVQRFLIESYKFVQMTCMSILHGNASANGQRDIMCYYYNQSSSLQFINNNQMVIQAALQLPVSLFKGLQHANRLFQLTIFTNGKLFAQQHNACAVLHVSFANATNATNELVEPLVIMLNTTSPTNALPAWWNTSAQDGQGEWSTDGCKVIKLLKHHVIFSCSYLSHYTLLVQSTELIVFDDVMVMTMLAPAVYVGSLICVIFMMVAIFLYIAYSKEIQMADKCKHALVNTWLCSLLLCLTFCFAIRLTMFQSWICQSIGIIVNYLSLCVLLWIIISLQNIRSKLYHPIISDESDSEDECDDKVHKKPMIRFYLFGWGIPIIICGMAGSIALPSYASDIICFPPLYASIGALFGPGALFTFIALGLCLRIWCLLPADQDDKQLISLNESLPDSSCHENDADKIEVEQHDILTLQESEDGYVDGEHSYVAQMRAQFAVLVLYLLCWASAAAYTINPNIRFFKPHINVIILSSIYCLFTAIYGLFIFLFYCCFRLDVRRCMLKMLQIKTIDPLSSQQQSDITITTTMTQATEPIVQPRSVSPPPLEKVEITNSTNNVESVVQQSTEQLPMRVSPRLIISNSHAGMLNRDSSNSVSSVALTDRSRFTYHTLKSLNGLRSQSPQTSIGFSHPVASAINSQVNYYNPHQQHIARKFFQKQREKRQRLNLQPLVNSESSRVEDSLDTSLNIPKQTAEDKVPNSLPVPNGTGVLSNGHASPNKPTDDALARSCCSPTSMVSLSKRSVQSDNLGKKRTRRSHRHSRSRSQNNLSNGTNSYPLRTHREERKKQSKMSRSISAYEQINNNNRYSSSSSDNDEKRVRRKPRTKHKTKNNSLKNNSLKKETSV